MTYALGFIGAGNMAEAIVRGALAGGVLSAGQMIACDPSMQRRELFASLGVRAVEAADEVIAGSGQVLLAVKPQTLPALGPVLAKLDGSRQVVQSIMAGIRCRRIEAVAGQSLRVVRIMPNTPLLVGLGMSGIALGEHAQPGDDALALKLFGQAGVAIQVDEAQLDAITAVSGSGPAYLFYLAEAMTAAAEQLGLGEHADKLARQTLLGAATLLAQSPDSAAELRRKVTSPGGTTQAAVSELDAREVKRAWIDAIAAACRRSEELGA